MAPIPNRRVVLYHYMSSPHSKVLVWYLTLRKIPYYQCLQSNTPLSPDLTQNLGIAYRRIPILCIGRDVYVDLDFILKKLEQLFPESEAHPSVKGYGSNHYNTIEWLFRGTVSDSGLFEFLLDHADVVGSKIHEDIRNVPASFSLETIRAKRPEAASAVRWYMHFMLETTFLADGRNWLGNTDGPSLLDLEAIWPLYWLYTIPGALPAEFIDRAQLPKVFAWIERFKPFVEAKQAQWPPQTLKSSQAVAAIMTAPFAEEEGDVMATELNLLKGEQVKMSPKGWGGWNKDTGKLVSLDETQIVIETKATHGSVRVHAPTGLFCVGR
ncbi:glutathione S-transferase [Annulohypoxylon bovei var. microspora]|nr:glutathione S-transferase [Annulohypoxylon bovei var. microspora]